jgi:hypothetical protein
MAIVINNQGDAASGFVCYFEIDHIFQAKDYLVRVTARGSMFNLDDTLNCTIDFHNTTDGIAGRFDNVVLPAKIPADNGLRRHTALRHFNVMTINDTPVASPVFP